MIIAIKSDAELKELINVLADEVINANVYYQLLLGLENSKKQYWEVKAQSPAFWSVITEALGDAYIMSLCRIYDQTRGSLSLLNLLETIKENRHFFQEENFQKRLHNNPFVDSLVSPDRVPSTEEIDKNIAEVNKQDALVKKLVDWRNKKYGHIDPQVVLRRDEILANNPIPQHEIEQLLDRSYEIINRYSLMYMAEGWSREMVGHGDYETLFEDVRLGLQKRKEDIEK